MIIPVEQESKENNNEKKTNWKVNFVFGESFSFCLSPNCSLRNINLRSVKEITTAVLPPVYLTESEGYLKCRRVHITGQRLFIYQQGVPNNKDQTTLLSLYPFIPFLSISSCCHCIQATFSLAFSFSISHFFLSHWNK